MRFARFAAVLTLAASFLAAQSDRATITGTIADPSGAGIPGAKVVAIHTATNVTATTESTSSGDFTIPQLPVGGYEVRVERDGFRSGIVKDITLTAGSTARVNVTLTIGAVTESISVSAIATAVQTDNAKTATSVSNRMVDELPLVVGGAMRSAFDLALTAPQTNRPQGTPNQGNEADKAFSIGGGQAGAYGANLDGVTILTGRHNQIQWASVNTPSVDAITEFSVETNGFKAEYGRAQGGLITFTSKSGTNEFHGTAYEFLRNNALDARRFFEAQKGVYKQHDFGWSAGGPVFIPKIYDGRNRTFFFASMEWFRNRVGASSERFNVPTPEMYQGDFSNWVDQNNVRIPIYDPATTRPNPNGTGFIRDPFPNNIIPQNRFSAFSRALLQNVGNVAFPNNGAAPGTSDYVRNNFINASGVRLDPWDKWSIKGDHNFGSNDKVTFLYNRGLHQIAPGADGFPGLPYPLNGNRVSNQDSNVYRFTYTKVITPTIVNYFYGGLNYYKDFNRALTYEGNWSAKGLCLKGAWNCDINFPAVEYSDYSTWGADALDGSDNDVRTFGDDLSITRGPHTFKMGYLYERILYGGFGQQKIAGRVRGDRLSTSVPTVNNLSTGGGNGFASFLLGEGYSGGTENERYVGQIFESHGMYFQDDWRVNSRLTVNFGLRYEFTLPPLERDDKWSDFDPNLPNPRAGGISGALRFAGFGEGRENARRITPGWYGGFGPRLGFAYQIDSRTVLRAAGARTFGVVKATTGSTHFDGAILNVTFANQSSGVTPAFRFDEGLPGYTRPPVIDPSFANNQSPAYWDKEAVRLPENYQWTFSLQRQLGNSLVFEGAYNATMGAHLVAGLKRINQVPFGALERYGRDLLAANVNSPQAQAAGIRVPYAGFNSSVVQALRPFPQYNDINTQAGHGDKSGHSTYHSMLLKVDQRFSNGLSFNASYVLSKLLTDADSYDADNSAADHYNRRLEKSIGQYDQTHNLRFNYVYDLPFGKGRRYLTGGIGGAILGNWRVGGVHMYASGYPLALTTSANYLVFNGRSPAQVTTYEGWVADRENANWRGGDRYFNSPESFAPASQQSNLRLGNATRYNPKAREPWQLEENFSVARMFPFTESIRLDFRWEIFNVFNRSRFNPGSTNIQDPNFGVVNSTLNDPRRMQVGLKIYW